MGVSHLLTVVSALVLVSLSHLVEAPVFTLGFSSVVFGGGILYARTGKDAIADFVITFSAYALTLGGLFLCVEAGWVSVQVGLVVILSAVLVHHVVGSRSRMSKG